MTGLLFVVAYLLVAICYLCHGIELVREKVSSGVVRNLVVTGAYAALAMAHLFSH